MATISRLRVLGLVGVALAALGAGEVSAGVWAWGCSGRVGDGQYLFNRYRLLRLPTAIGPADLLRLIFLTDMTTDPMLAKIAPEKISRFQAEDANSGLAERMVFFAEGDGSTRLDLIQTRSKRVSHKLVPGCRDEITDRFAKTYRIELHGAPATTAEFVCFDYTLSTRGGRSCE